MSDDIHGFTAATVFLIWLSCPSACQINKNAEELTERINANANMLEKKIDSYYNIKTQNVMGNEKPEKFYEIGGKRVYLEIDGTPVEDYFKKYHVEEGK